MLGQIFRRIAANTLVACLMWAGSVAAQENEFLNLDRHLVADWTRADWTADLLAHVDANLDSSLPLEPMGWTEGLRFAAYDCWTLEEGGGSARRDYNDCNDRYALIDKRMHDIVWVLVRHEWNSYLSTISAGQRRVAAWSLEQAIGEYRNLLAGAEPRSSEPQSTTLKRLRIIRSMVDEIASINDGEYQSGLERRQWVREEINRQLALDGAGSALEDIVGPIQKLTRDAMLTYISGVEAELDTKALAVLVFGSGGGDSDTSDYLSDDERSSLSLAELAKRPGQNVLYEFVRDAVIERPNAIGIAERYSKMKKSLFDSKEAKGRDAKMIELRWPQLPDPDGRSKFSLLELLYTDKVVPVPPGKNQSADYVTLEEACDDWAKRKNSAEGRCPFRILADRALPASDKTDTFGILARERLLQQLFTTLSMVNSDKYEYEAFVALLKRLEDQTKTDGEPILALPYLLRPLPTESVDEQHGEEIQLILSPALGDFNSDFCGANPAALFRSNRCEAEEDAFDAKGDRVPSNLSERLRRLIVGQPPDPKFKEKIASLKQKLKNLGGDFDLKAPLNVDSETFIGKVCRHSGQFLPALHRAGMRSVIIAPTTPGVSEVNACR